MIEPLNALLIASIGGFIFLFFFWPEKGFFWKWKRGKANTKRILVEDGLKHLYDQEYKHLTCTLQSLSGALNISGDAAARLITRLQSLGLIRTEKDRIESESMAFHRRVHAGYLDLARKNPKRFCVVNVNRPLTKVHADIWKAVRDVIQR